MFAMMTTTTHRDTQPDPDPHPINAAPPNPHCVDTVPPEPCRVDAVSPAPRRVDAVSPEPRRVDTVAPAPRRIDTVSHTWHITFGTYAARLHNDPRPTVDRRHNIPGTPFPPPDPTRQVPPTEQPLYLTYAQCIHIEKTIPQLCKRGGWTYRTCAAPNEPTEPGRVGPAHTPGNADHVHTLLDAPAHIHGKQVRHWLKRWLTQSLTQTFGPPPKQWWADAGSTKPVLDTTYLLNATNYIHKQRTTPAP